MKKKLIILILVISVLNLKSQNISNHFYYGIAALNRTDFKKAEIELKEAISEQNNNPVYYKTLGNIYLKQKKISNAISNYKIANNLNTKFCLLELAKAYAMFNNADSAVYFLKKYLASPQKLAKIYVYPSEKFDNIRNSTQWQELWNNNFYNGASALMNEIYVLYENQNYWEALNSVNDVLKKYKNYPDALFMKGKILEKLNDIKNAIQYYSKAINKSPRNKDYLWSRANAYEQIGKYKLAEEDLNNCTKINPYDLNLFKKIAEVQLKTKEFKKAQQNLLFYLKFFPDNEEAKIELAAAYNGSGDYLSTIKITNELFAVKTIKPEYYFIRANAYLNTEMYEQAYHDFSQALDIDPQMTECYYYRGIVNMKLQKIDEACADWHKAIENRDFRANDYYYKYCKKFDEKLKKIN